MSRFEFEGPRFRMVLGVDNVTSVFFQIHDDSIEDEYAQLILKADNLGVTASASPSHFNAQQLCVIGEMIEAFEWARQHRHPYPNIDAERLDAVARAFEIPLTKKEIYEILD